MIFLPVDDLRDEEIYLRLDSTAEARPERGYLPAYYFSICLPDGTKAGNCDLRVGHGFLTPENAESLMGLIFLRQI